MKALSVLGISFRTASPTAREVLSLSRDETIRLLRGAAEVLPGLEAVVLASEGRLEFYLALPPRDGALESWLYYLRGFRPEAPLLRPDCHRYEIKGLASARHLFRVACGMGAALVEEEPIASRIETARLVAAQAGTLGDSVHQLFNQAVAAANRAQAGLMLVGLDSEAPHPAEEILNQRRLAIPALERIVEEEVRAWTKWQAALPMEGMIEQLYQQAADQSREAARHLVGAETLTTEQAERIVLHSLKHLLHTHANRLRSLGGRKPALAR